MKALALLLIVLAWTGQAQNAPLPSPPLVSLCRSFNEAVDWSQKSKFLDQIALTPPANSVDMSYLFDIFMRYPAPPVEAAALGSLARLHGPNPDIESLLVGYFEQPDPDPRFFIFAIRAAYQLRSPQSLPFIEKIARGDFKFPSPDGALSPKEKNLWRARYEALDALALWPQKNTFKLLVKKTSESPLVARILAARFWPRTLPLIEKWSRGSAAKKEAATQAAEAAVPKTDLEATYDAMLEALANQKLPKTFRHQLAIKVGLCADDGRIADLIKRYRSTSDKEGRLMLETALFSSRSPKILPLLLEYIKTDPDPARRAGARIEAKEIMKPADYQALLEWVSKNDPDAENREQAARELGNNP